MMNIWILNIIQRVTKKNVKSYIDINITINGKITISGKELNL